MYLSLIITFLLLLIIIITGIQNSTPLEVKFIIWKLPMSATALGFYFAVLGAAIVAVLTLPKLLTKYLRVRSLNKQLYELKDRAMELEKQTVELEKQNVEKP